MPPCDDNLWRLIARGDPENHFLHGVADRVTLGALTDGTSLDCPLGALAGASVLVATDDQLSAALAAIELDGIARRLVLCPPDLSREHLPHILRTAEIDAMVSDGSVPPASLPAGIRLIGGGATVRPAAPAREPLCRTEWVLLTSGTTGVPKLVAHTLASLTGAINPGRPVAGERTVWSTFYDVRRYGGLQIFLRAMLGGTSMVLSSGGEPVADFLARAGALGVTHISGTPSHWRRALMSPAADRIAPRYARLSGEIADQAILDDLRARYPEASVGHAFASTEAGVAFDVNDGLAGFPASLIGHNGEVEMKVADGSLRIRSPRNADRYLGDVGPLKDPDGFVDNGDMLERRGDRYHFVGRRGGIINVGGLKVHPEEVEAVINRHSAVQMSLVRARKNPFTGAVVVAEVMLRPGPTADAALQDDIIAACRAALAAHKVPATIRFLPALNVGGAGKLARTGA